MLVLDFLRNTFFFGPATSFTVICEERNLKLLLDCFYLKVLSLPVVEICVDERDAALSRTRLAGKVHGIRVPGIVKQKHGDAFIHPPAAVGVLGALLGIQAFA